MDEEIPNAKCQMPKTFLVRNFKTRNSSLGFTLIELLIVISIIGILATIFISTFSSSQQRARDGQRKFDLKNLQGALEQYYYSQTTQTYPACASGSIGANSCLVNALQGTSPATGQNFLKTPPSDPLSGTTTPYIYGSLTTSSSSCGTTPCPNYVICAKLENTSDPDHGTCNCSLNAAYTYAVCAP